MVCNGFTVVFMINGLIHVIQMKMRSLTLTFRVQMRK